MDAMRDLVLTICVGLLLTVGSAARGQYAVDSAPGHALDAPLNVGPTTEGGGFLGGGLPLNAGNPLITGNVRFGRGFEGRVGYTSPYTFQGTLQSSALNAFRSGSVNYGDVLGGTVPLAGPIPYYPANSTILGAGDVLAGRSLPGTNQPRMTGMQPTAPGEPLDLRVGGVDPIESAAPLQSAAPLDVSLYRQYGVRPGEGLPTRSTLSMTADRMLFVPPTAEAQGRGNEGGILPADPRIGMQQREPLPARDATAAGSLPQDARLQPLTSLLPAAAAEAPAKPKGEDVFEDLRVLTTPGTVEQALGAGQGEQPGPRQGEAGPSPGAREGPSGGEAPAAEITTFAGTRATPLNVYLRDAEQLMKSGDYDRAAGKYSVASTASPENPLPRLGWANAMIGQRMYLTAASHLRAAFKRFPQLFEVSMDLPAFFPSRAAYGQILLDLVAEIADPRQGNDMNLRLVLAYAFYFSGRPTDAERHLKVILKADPQDDLAAALLRAVESKPAQEPVIRP
jgi:hypothetical protein